MKTATTKKTTATTKTKKAAAVTKSKKPPATTTTPVETGKAPPPPSFHRFKRFRDAMSEYERVSSVVSAAPKVFDVLDKLFMSFARVQAAYDAMAEDPPPPETFKIAKAKFKEALACKDRCYRECADAVCIINLMEKVRVIEVYLEELQRRVAEYQE